MGRAGGGGSNGGRRWELEGGGGRGHAFEGKGNAAKEVGSELGGAPSMDSGPALEGDKRPIAEGHSCPLRAHLGRFSVCNLRCLAAKLDAYPAPRP